MIHLTEYQLYQIIFAIKYKHIIKYFYNINKLGLISKNIKNFYKINTHKDLDIYGNNLISKYYPKIWIDAYAEPNFLNFSEFYIAVYQKKFTKLITLNKRLINNKLNRPYINYYDSWLNRFVNKEHISIRCINLRHAIYLALIINRNLSKLNNWLFKLFVKKRKEKMLYQLKCLPIFISNQINNLYENNEW